MPTLLVTNDFPPRPGGIQSYLHALVTRLPDQDLTVQGHSVAGLLELLDWTHADYIKCDIEGSELAVFADPNARWLQLLDVLAIESHDAIQPGSSDAVAACFDPLLFEKSRHGEADIYQRRIPLRAVARKLEVTGRAALRIA